MANNNGFTYRAELVCESCGQSAIKRLTAQGLAPADPSDEYSYDSDKFPKPCNVKEPADGPQSCGICGKFLENALTQDGVYLVQDYLNNEGQGPELSSALLANWAKFYGFHYDAEKVEWTQ